MAFQKKMKLSLSVYALNNKILIRFSFFTKRTIRFSLFLICYYYAYPILDADVGILFVLNQNKYGC